VNGVTFAKAQKEMRELVPVLKTKVDFSKKELFPDIPGCYYSPGNPDSYSYTEKGADFKGKGKSCIAVFPSKNNPMKDFQRNPFEVILEITPLQYPAKDEGQAGILDMSWIRFEFNRNRRLKVVDIMSKKPLELNKRMELRLRYDGQQAWLYINGELEGVKDASLMRCFSDVNFQGIRICNVDVRYHKIEFYELKEKK